MKTCCHASVPTGEAAATSEVDYWRQHFWNALIWSAPLFLLSMGEMMFPRFFSTFLKSWGGWMQFLLTLPVLFGAGIPIWQRGLKSSYHGPLNMFSLIVVGVGVTFFYSSWQLFMPSNQHGHEFYFEAAAMIMVLVLLGQFLESLGRKRAGSSLQELLEATPSVVTLIVEGNESEVPVSTLRLGDFIRIYPGEKIPVDGILIEGSSFIDESLLTGESLPVEKKESSSIHAGTLNQHGSFVMRVEQVGAATMLGQIREIMIRSQQHRAPVQQLADRIAAKVVPCIFVIALLTFCTWYFMHPELGGAFALARAISVLMITCPCALGLATPLALTVGIGSAAREGILVRDSTALEQLSTATEIVFDKTGTLTEGKFKVSELKSFSTLPLNEWLSILVAAERGSEHPLGTAILHYGETKNIVQKTVSFFQVEPGGGIRAIIEGREVLVGNQKFLEKEKVELSKGKDFFGKQHGTIMAMAIDHILIGAVLLSDPVKSEATKVVKSLVAMGLKVAMLTGDRDSVARQVAQQLEISIWKAGLSPQEKAAQICAWQQEHEKVAMVGDGMNDGPALSVAHVSLAMHQGSNLAKETAGIILMKPSLRLILNARMWSHRIMLVVRQNLFFAFVYNLLAVPLAAGLFYSSTGLLLNPMLATAAMSLSSLSVIVNSLRLGKCK